MSDLDDAINEAKAYIQIGGLNEYVLNEIARVNDVTLGDLLESLGWGQNYYKKEEHTMTLGEKLKVTFKELEQARIEGAEVQHNADMEKIRRERADIDDKLDKMRYLFVEQIEAGKVPFKKIKNTEWKDWVKAALRSGKASHQDRWNEFTNFWAKEGLSVRINDAHDGGGMEDWINVTLVLLPARPRSSENNIGIQQNAR
jgi:hypothetical protein